MNSCLLVNKIVFFIFYLTFTLLFQLIRIILNTEAKLLLSNFKKIEKFFFAIACNVRIVKIVVHRTKYALTKV